MAVVAMRGTPDLRASPAVLSAEAFADVVRNGARMARGMPAFKGLSDAQLESLRHYLHLRQQSELALDRISAETNQ